MTAQDLIRSAQAFAAEVADALAGEDRDRIADALMHGATFTVSIDLAADAARAALVLVMPNGQRAELASCAARVAAHGSRH